MDKKQLNKLILSHNKVGYLQRNPADIENNVREIIISVIPIGTKQVAKFAKELKGKNDLETCFNIHKFVRKFVKPFPDPYGKEYISYPYFTIVRGKGDCEDFSGLIGSLLAACKINSALRVADCNDGYMHIYNIVPSVKLVIDGTLPVCGSEIKRTKYKDYAINQLQNAYALRTTWKHKKNGLGRIGVNPSIARQKGQFDENGNIYFRQSNITDKIIKGKSCKIGFSLDVEENGYYALIPAKLLQPSHLGNIENPLHFLPEAQPRNRARSESGANTPRLIAEKLRPSEICEGSTAYSGCPIINERGEVIQGNGRGYTMKYYWENFSTDPKYYIQYLSENEKTFFNKSYQTEFLRFYHAGISSPAQIKQDIGTSIDYPVLVRVIPCSDERAIELGQLKQSDTEAVSLSSGNIKSKINLIDDKLRDSLINSIFPEGGSLDLSLSHAIQGSDASHLLIKKGIYRADEWKEKFIDRSGMFLNAEGVKEISNLIIGLIFKDADTNTLELFKDLPDRIQTALIKSSPYILNCSPENRIIKEVGNSIMGIHDYLRAKSNGDSFHAWKTQGSMFGGTKSEQYKRTELGIIKLIGDSRTQIEIVQAFKKYQFLTSDEKNGMFGMVRNAIPQSIAIEQVFWYDYIQLKKALINISL